MSEACFYELAESMIKAFEDEFNLIKRLRNQENKILIELVPRIAHATEYLAKALIYALATSKRVCEEMQKHHDVSKLLTRVCSNSPIPLNQREVKAIAGIAILNAMFCNRVMWSIVRYGVESLGIRFPEATQKSVSILEGWENILENIINLLEGYYNVAKRIIKKAGTFVIEITKCDFSNGNTVKKVISKLRPTALYAHARVRIKLVDELLDKSYEVRVKFEADQNIQAPVRCEVCLWDINGELANEHRGSPKDYIYLAGGRGTIIVKAGKVNNRIINEIEPRVWKPGGIKFIEIEVIEERYQ